MYTNAFRCTLLRFSKAYVMNPRWTLHFSLLFLFVLQANAQSWTGRWESCWPDGCAILELLQDGNRVTGTYPLYDGVIEGTVEGRTLRGTFTEPDHGGRIVYTLSPDGQTFFGRDDVGDWWNGGRLPDVPAVQPRTADLTTPRGVLRSFLLGFNAIRLYGLEHWAEVLPTLSFADDAEPPVAWDRVERAHLLFDVLDLLTVRLYDLPSFDLVGPDTTVVLTQSGTENEFTVRFVLDAAGAWHIVVPSREVLTESRTLFLRARGLEQPVPDYHLRLRDPRSTMRAFLEGMRTWNEGGDSLARRTLDLSGIEPSVRDLEFPLVADLLRQVLARTSYLVVQEIPDNPDSEAPYVHFVHPMGRIVIAARDTEAGRIWQFTPETVSHLRDLYDVIDEMPVADSLLVSGERAQYLRIRDGVRAMSPKLLARSMWVENWQWIGFFLLGFVAYGLGKGLSMGLRLGPESLRPGERPLALVLSGGMALWGILNLGLPELFVTTLRALSLSIVIVGGVWLTFVGINAVQSVLRRVSGVQDDLSFDDTLLSLVAGLLKIIVAIAGLLFLADALYLPYQSVLAGIGIGGLAFAFAAQETVANFFGSAIIMADRPFRKGDLVRVGAFTGVIEHVGLRSTRIRTADDSVLTMPNNLFAKETIDNLGQRRARRIELMVGVTYDTPADTLEAFRQALEDVASKHPACDGRPVSVGLAGFGESSIDYRLVCFLKATTPQEEQEKRHSLMMDIVERARSLGVEFAFPTRTLIHQNAP